MHKLKIVLRSLWKHRLFAGINVFSLTFCLASVITMLLLVSKLVTFDGFHEHGDRLYGLMEGYEGNPLAPGTVFPIAERLHADFPEVERYTRMLTWDTYILSYGQGDWSVTPDFVDPDFLHMFSFPLRYGNAETALSGINSIILSDQLALRIFGDINPVGKEITWNDSLRLTVTGVLKPLPGASSLTFSAVMPMQWLYDHTPNFKNMADAWNNSFVTAYLLLKPGVDQTFFQRKLSAAATNYYPVSDQEVQLGLIHFKDITQRYEPMLPYYVGGLRLLILFLVLIAGANLINLTSASALYRVREIGVRTVLGSLKRQVLGLFLLETAVVVLIALVISLCLLPPIIDYFNAEVLTEFSVDFRWQQDYLVIAQVVFIFIFLAFLSAWIPAKRLLHVPVPLSLKGQTASVPNRNFLQNSLIVVQFSLAVVFVFLTVVVQQQMRFVRKADLGFDKENVMVFNASLGFKDREKAFHSLDHTLKNLRNFPEVERYSVSQNVPGQYRNWFNTLLSGDQKVYCRVSYGLDSAYFPTYGIHFLAGANFYDSNAVAKQDAVILNKKATLALGWTPDEAIGKVLQAEGENATPFTVIGVTEDFNYRALNSGIEPLAHFSNADGGPSIIDSGPFVSIRIAPSRAQPVVAYLRDAFSKIPSTGTFSYSYSSEIFDKQYERQDTVMTLIAIAGAIAIFIACAGTFGLAAQLARLRTKEIGIRKVLGASVAELTRLLSRRFAILVLISLLIALPIGYLAGSLWLEIFPYRTEIAWWMFALTGLGVLAVTLITVSFRAVKTAMANPVDSLRDE